MKMIDLHCHILYDIDDGAKTKEDSAALLHTAVQNEIKAIIAKRRLNFIKSKPSTRRISLFKKIL